MKSTKKRYDFIDVAKFIAVFFVMIDHVQYYNVPFDDRCKILRVIWIAFFLPVFFISAGMFFEEKENFKSFILEKIKTLLVPYFLWCFALNFVDNRNIDFFKGILIGTVDSLDASGTNSVLWFLPCFFVSYIILYGVEKINSHFTSIYKMHGVYVLEIFGLLFIDRFLNFIAGKWLFFGLKSAFCGAALMIVGKLLKPILCSLDNERDCVKIATLLFSLIIGTVVAFLNMPVIKNENGIGYKYAIWMANGQEGKNPFLYILATSLLSISIFVLSMFLKRINILAYCGQHTLLFMTFHVYTHNILSLCISSYLIKYFSTDIAVFVFALLSALIILIFLPIIDIFCPFIYRGSKY